LNKSQEEKQIRKAQKLFLIIFAVMAIFTASAFVKMTYDAVSVLKNLF